MESKECACCSKRFHPRPQSPNQIFCSSPACQRERRRRWQQKRRHGDPEYRDNQSRAQATWSKAHPDYWREYRRTHPAYCERNRVRRRERSRLEVTGSNVAKMDVSTRESPVPSGTYRLSPVRRTDVAKMDAWTVEITLISMPTTN
jgi:hypothetical protein